MNIEAMEGVLTGDGFDVWIEVDGEQAPQYVVESQETEAGTQISCWIASTSGKAFSIQVNKVEDDYDYAVEVHLDDHMVVNTVYTKDQTQATISSVWISANQKRSFMFASLDMTDDDKYLEQSHSKNIGTIKVVAARGKDEGVSGPFCAISVPEIGKVHERSKKGLTHQVNYGPPIQLDVSGESRDFEEDGQPVTFLFKYRPLDMLQANGIAPRMHFHSEEEDNKPEVIDLESDDEAADDAKERELIAQLEAVQKRKRKRQSDGPVGKKLKAEPAPHFTPGEVIDLTL